MAITRGTPGFTYCDHCDEVMYGTDDYMVHDAVWTEGAEPHEHLHARCLQKRLGRLLVAEDFDLELPTNLMVKFGFALRPLAEALEFGKRVNTLEV